MHIGTLEAALLRLLWDSREPATASELHRALSRDHDIAYTTVSTCLQRMANKGLVAQDRTTKAHRFATLVAREDLLSDLISEAMGLVGTEPGTFTRFLGEMDPPSLEKLRKALDEVQGRS